MSPKPTKRQDVLPTTTPESAASTPEDAAREARLRALEDAGNAMEKAFGTGKADRAEITRRAHDKALKAADLVEIAIDADAEADEMARLAIITENSQNRDKIKAARQRAKDARRTSKQAHRDATAVAKDAYEDIKFSEPGKLGFMRVIQIVFALNIAATLFTLLMTSRDVMVYDVFTIMSWIEIMLQGIALWFFINYYKVTRPFVMGMSAFCIVVPTIVDIASGTFNLVGTLISSSWYIFLFLYFWLSKRVKAVMVNDFSTYRPEKVHASFEVKRRGWPFVRNLIMYFIIFSVLGHWMEAAMCQLIRLGLVRGEYDPSNTMLWRDWLYPYPMEGAAVVIIALVLYPLWQHWLHKWPDKPFLAYALSFVVNGLTCGVIEFSMGLIVNANHQLWDYTDMPFNIMGQVCLQNVLAFAAAASLICWLVYPLLERWLSRIPEDTMNIVFVVVAVFGGILWSLYIVDPPSNHDAERAALAQQESQQSKDAANLETELEADYMILNSVTTDLRIELDRNKSLDAETRTRIQQQIDQLDSAARELAELADGAAEQGEKAAEQATGAAGQATGAAGQAEGQAEKAAA